MKTLKDFKNAMTVGSTWEFWTDNSEARKLGPSWCHSPVIRTCTIRQTNACALTHPTKGGVNSWLYWPKVKDMVFVENGDKPIVKIKGFGKGEYIVYKLIAKKEG